MNANKVEFLRALAELVERHNAAFYYTTDDDGVHVEADDEWLLAIEDFSDPILSAKALRERADTLEWLDRK